MARITEVAWQAYAQAGKSPVTRKAGAGFADPEYDLSVEWIAACQAIERAPQAPDAPHAPSRIPLINSASRSERTCPGESSKSYRLLTLAREVLQARPHTEVEVLDLCRLSAEYGHRIHPWFRFHGSLPLKLMMDLVWCASMAVIQIPPARTARTL